MNFIMNQLFYFKKLLDFFMSLPLQPVHVRVCVCVCVALFNRLGYMIWYIISVYDKKATV